MKVYSKHFRNRMGLVLIIYTASIFSGHSQKKEYTGYMAVIERLGSKDPVRGLLYQVGDSSVVVFLGNPKQIEESSMDDKFATVAATDIYRIKLRPAGKVAKSAKKGAIYGTVAGLALGALEAAAYESDPWLEAETGEFLLAGAISGAITGTIYGAIIGSIKTKIPIDGNQQRYYYQSDFLRGHAYDLGLELQTQSKK